MRILILNQAFYPDVVATAQQASDLAQGLAAAGHEVTAIAGARAYDDAERRFPRREQWGAVCILRVGSTRFGKAARWRRAVDFATWILACVARLLTLPRQDVVIALTSPPLISFIGALYVRLRGGKLVFWSMDLNPDEAVAAGWLRKGSATERVLQWILRFSLRQAAAIVALDRFMRDRIAAKGVPGERIHILPPWAADDCVRYDAAGRERFRAEHGLDGKFVVMYSGNHSPCHPLTTLLAAAERMAADGGVVFCFVGGGSEFARVKRAAEFARQRGVNNIVALPYRPASELAGSLSAADLHVVVMGDAFRGIVHPCKLYNALAVGAPLLYVGPRESHVTDFASHDSSVRLFASEHGDVEGVVANIQRAREQAEPRAIPEALAQVGKSVLMPRLVRIVESIVERAAERRRVSAN